MSKNKIAIAISLFLIFAMTVSFLPLQVSAQDTMKTYAIIGAVPNPVGVGQQVLLHIGITQQLATTIDSWEGLTVTVTRPDDHTETLGPYTTDATGGTGDIYVPTMTGEYTFQTHFPEQVCEEGVGAFGNRPAVPPGCLMLASDSEVLTLVVQEEQLPSYPGVPLPSEYWTRPINAQFYEWYSIAGDWLGYPRYDAPYLPYNDNAPNSGHILWAKQLVTGGLAGGLSGIDNRTHAYECGDAYEGKFASSVILGGVLFYNHYESRMPTQEVVAVDLHTGEELWCRPLVDPDGVSRRLAFGQAFYFDSFNYHGVFGYLWTTAGSSWHAYNPVSGDWVYSYTNVPSGTSIYGENGEICRSIVDLTNGWMALWNSSRAVQPQSTGTTNDGSWRPQGNIYDAMDTGIEWNITIPTGLPGSAREVVLGERVFGADLSQEEVTSWAFSLKEGQEGQSIYKKTVALPSYVSGGNMTVELRRTSVADGAFVLWMKETREWYGYSTENGEKLWGPTEPEGYLNIYASSRDGIGYGKLFTVGYSGVLHCYDLKTGERLWSYTAIDPYNEILWSNDWPIYMGFITDGKIYVHSTEHSSVDPKPRGASLYCIDIETGEEVFVVNIRGHHWGESPLIGDSIIAMYNSYDQRIYAVGKGPSETAISIQDDVVTIGDSVLVKGAVTDISPGTQEYALTARFPNGVPVVSDANMSEWMQYVYMQFPPPADAIGVDVVIEVLDPNGNSYEVGTTTTDSDGFFKLAFTPPVPGEYTVTAKFAGTESYYGSHAKTAINVEESLAATSEPTSIPASTADLYILPGITGIIIAIAVVGAVLILMLRKR